MNNKNEETWLDFIDLVDPQVVMAYKQICKNEIEFEKFIFGHSMSINPKLINKYRHLLEGTDSLYWVLENFPQTKLYLE